MSERRGNGRWLAIGALALVACVVGAAKVAAQEQNPAGEAKPATEQAAEASKGPNTGRLSISAGVYLDDNLKAINGGDRVQVIGTLGLAFTS